ncbi:MAG: hypothetical protein A2351_06090 [Omnitrophica bacterium RIFOXYB12_FULL_50_7]|nr:MAG: hypothetical protein A2351_06090 [Omnitrophica bacterium RIFOXYB12_FULL_50_7]
MSDYIKTWRKEHGQILEILLQVLQLEIFSRAGQMKLQELKRSLEAHLKSEDLGFYPVLKKAAETDTDLRRKLFLFAADMDKIAAEIRAFFKKVENDPMGKDIPVEFRKISDMIKSRIFREENVLMREFEKLT